MEYKNYDFGGWATKNDLLCSDGRIIRKDAFRDQNNDKVPLVWNHAHNDPRNVLGHAYLANKKDGVYAYCYLNDTEDARVAKSLIKHGDIDRLSIHATKLKQQGPNVMHGEIKEVSLVIAGANPGASIDNVLIHGEQSEEDLVIYTGDYLELEHSDEDDEPEEVEETTGTEESLEHAESDKKEDQKGDNMANKNKNEETVQDVIDSMNEKQKNVLYYLVGEAAGDSDDDDTEGGNEDMKHNVFDTEEETMGNTLTHAEMETIISDGKRYGSLKESFLAHADEYGIQDIEVLFPEARTLNNTPEFIKRDTGWVSKVMGAVHKTPFSRIKSVFADITEDEARAKGYIKGKMKKEEVFSLLKRSTTPTTIYKKQKLDRDDVIDITDFDVVAWIKGEMRIMLDEEIARAILLGDGRLASDDDKINESNIRPVIKDADLYTIKKTVDVASAADDDAVAKAFIRSVIKSRKDYKGSGNPTLFTTEDMLTNMLLLTDEMGRDLYESEDKLRTKLRVKEIVTVEVMEGMKGAGEKPLMGVLVNLADYNVGADKGGAVNMFDDFDIDYNQMKYLMETRCSGALTKPYSAITYELNKGAF